MKLLRPPGPAEISNMDTASLRGSFLVEELFRPGEVQLVHTGLDRLIAGGICPAPELRLPRVAALASQYFTERRELGVINLGAPGEVQAGPDSFAIGRLECLYVGMEERDIVFRSCHGGLAEFYILSAPAHKKFPTRSAELSAASIQRIGTPRGASVRTLVQYIHEGGIQSCQLVMGYTVLEQGSVWNTWPPHTHSRRSEVYLYFGLGTEPLIHLMGEPEASRHLVVRDKELVLSPSWSMHSGVGTSAYSFIWGMAGENKSFADTDPVDLAQFR